MYKVEDGGNHRMTTSMHHHRPMTGLEGKFSMEFCMAILLLDGKAGPTAVHRRYRAEARCCRR